MFKKRKYLPISPKDLKGTETQMIKFIFISEIDSYVRMSTKEQLILNLYALPSKFATKEIN